MKTLKVSQAMPALLITYVIALISMIIPMFWMGLKAFTESWMNDALTLLSFPMIVGLVIGLIIAPIIFQRMYQLYPANPPRDHAPKKLLGFIKCIMQIPIGCYLLIAFDRYIVDVPSGWWNLFLGMIVGYLYAKLMLQVIKLIKSLSRFLDKMVTDQL